MSNSVAEALAPKSKKPKKLKSKKLPQNETVEVVSSGVAETHSDVELVSETSAIIQQPQPTVWFSKHYPDEKPEDLAERYRVSVPIVSVEAGQSESYSAFKRLMEERLMERSGGPRPMLPGKYVAQTMQSYHRPRRTSRVGPVGMAMLGLVAVLSGGAMGLSISESRQPAQDVARAPIYDERPIAAITPVSPDQKSVARVIVPPITEPRLMTASLSTASSFGSQSAQPQLERKPISSPFFDVIDVHGVLNSEIPLPMHAEIPPDHEPLAFRISGLPDTAYLTTGTQIEKGNWMVKPADIGSVRLFVPKADNLTFDLEVSPVIEATGALAAPTKGLRVTLEDDLLEVVPASAPPETVQIKLPEGAGLPMPLSQ